MPTLGLNAVLSAGASLLGLRADPYAAYRFHVEFEGLIAGGFSEVTGLQVETVVETYREGGLNEYEHKLAGPTRYPTNLTLKHGVTAIDTLWGWHQDVVAGRVERRNGSIYLLGRDGLPVLWWDVREACPVRWTGPDLRADSSTVAVESVELVHRGLSRPAGGTLLGGALGALGGAADISGGISL